MDFEEKEISYTSTNTYAVLNSRHEKTKTVWFVCHGMGYLSQYFLKYFKALDASENYIIAPQAPSKYYIQPKMHVGANWLTRHNTMKDNANIMAYFDAVFNAENLPSNHSLIIFGYSQGVSVAMRYLASRKIQCSQLILHSGGIPKELVAKDFDHLNHRTKVKLIYGTKDEYLDAARIANEIERAQELFGDKVELMPFDGTHEVNVDYINQLVQT